MLKPKKKRVLVIDGAVVVRRLLADAISQDPALEVAGTASNGRLALARFPSLQPDLVLLDIEMPSMDGLETVRELRRTGVRVPILLFSTVTERGAAATLEALSAGATDYVTKLSNTDLESTKDIVATELIPKIRALCHLPDALAAPSTLPAERIFRGPRATLPARIVAIGVSTGGPDALAHLIPALPPNLPVPVVIAQHMPPIFTAMLAQRLTEKSALPVRECASGEPLASGCAFLAPGNFHMVVDNHDGVIRLRTHQGPKENYCRPSVDVLFRSVAEVFGERTLAVILTGMGRDGLRGSESLRLRGAQIFAQDEASSLVWGMPGFVARAGLADKVLPLDRIAAEIVNACSRKPAESLSG